MYIIQLSGYLNERRVELLLLTFIFFPPPIISIMLMSWMFGSQYKEVIVKLPIFLSVENFYLRC